MLNRKLTEILKESTADDLLIMLVFSFLAGAFIGVLIGTWMMRVGG